ncbi:MAG TPA: alpha-amylase family protein [Bryobacteraceae bacterium]|nr:alpha-amylase family protein [Bryobacteraceae bacterium]
MPIRPLLLLMIASNAFSQDGWWMKEPVRWVQTNLRETDANLDVARLMSQLTDMRANVLHFGMGGITAYYPTKTLFHYPSPHMPAGRDLFGEVVREAHARKIRVVGRYDLSKTRKEVFDAHPEWFFRKANGEPVVYNGLYSTCINGGYYRDQAMKILAEGLERYDVDGLFFNMFGNQSRDYSGVFVGHCHCAACQTKYKALYGKAIPAEPDEQYRQFMFQSSREVASDIGKLIKAKRPNAGYFNYIQEYTDGIMSESNTAVERPLPLWPYASSDNTNRARNSEPSKMSINLNMQAFDFSWRFATVPAPEVALRFWQNVAHGGAAGYAVNGTLDLQDRQAIETAKPIYRWLADHEQFYSAQQSLAKVLLLGGSQRTGRTYNQAAYRGAFRILTEQHIPFAVADNMDWLGKRDYDLVIATDWAPPELKQYVERGGRVLIVSPRPPEFEIAKVVAVHRDVKGYMRVRDHNLFPGLKQTSLLMLNGQYTEVEAADTPAALTLVPPSMFGPPEKVHIDQVDTTKPGLAIRMIGKGTVAWIPWDATGLYYRHSLTAHAAMIANLIDHLLPNGRQLTTNAHPLVELSLMKRNNRTLLHLINVSGHSGTAYFEPIPMGDIRISLKSAGTKARAIRSGAELLVESRGGKLELTVPKLTDYELVLIE